MIASPAKTTVWRRSLGLFRPYGKEALAIAVFVLAGAALSLLPAFVMQNLFDRAFPARDPRLLAIDAAVLFASTLGSAVLKSVQTQINARLSQTVLRDMRLRLLEAVQAAPLSFLGETKTGELLNRASGDVDKLEQTLSSVLVTTITNVLSLLAVSVVLLALSWELALLAFALVPAVMLAMRYATPKLYAATARYNAMRDRASALLHDLLSISGSTLVRSYSREEYELRRFTEASNDLMAAALAVARIGSWTGSLLMSVIGLATPVLILAGGVMMMNGHLTLGTLIGFLSLLAMLLAPVMGLGSLQTQVAGGLSVLERIFQYLDDLPKESPDGSSRAPLGSKLGIAFEDVRFSYGGVRVLDGVSFEANPSEVIAIVGGSGAGKTTVANLLMRFVEPDAGTIRVGGADVRSVAARALRERIGIVAQETHLIHDTIENNIRFARPAATRAEVVAAAQAAEIDEFVSRLPQRYDTVVGESGYKLSGGQRQRIAIARALLKDPSVLILDEATSSLDDVTERAVQSSLAMLMRGRTCIVIAHRLSAVRHASRVYVLAEGRLVVDGTAGERVEHLDRGRMISGAHDAPPLATAVPHLPRSS
ncbi:MAG: ATP-binding cassette, subfamily bacterial [Candidatus Eremiobacteraeota bacterium]|nr:ATP-binding cassette, subfamily bacterial [Candidatus Eremiobacteraeota bacterium]